jgi:hypothetical protein
VNLEDITDRDDYWRDDGAPREPPAAARRHQGSAEPGAAKDEDLPFRPETPEEKAARLERLRPEFEAARERVRQDLAGLASRFTMPGTAGRVPGPVRHIEDPDAGERTRREIERLRREGLYHGPHADA